MQGRWRAWMIGGLVCLGLLLAETVRLESVPAVWWDEGWTLTVARTWVEQGHFGRLLEGEPASSRLAGSFTVIMPISWSFQLFGVGIWQGRIVIVAFALSLFLVWYWLTQRLTDRRIAVASFIILFLTASHPVVHPLLLGRQILGEIPALFYALVGYGCLLFALQHSVWQRALVWIGGAGLFWGLALHTKLQVGPFWLVSLLIPLGWLLYTRRLQAAGLLGGGLLSALVMYQLLLMAKQIFLPTVPGEPIPGIYSVTALVPIGWVRWKALSLGLSLGLPTCLGLCYGMLKWLKNREPLAEHTKREVAEASLRLALLSLAGSWFGWYVLLSNGWPRYLFPPLFLSSLFVASFLAELTDGFRFSTVFRRRVDAMPQQGLLRVLGAVSLILLIGTSGLKTGRILYYSFTRGDDDSVVRVAQFLNAHTPADALVETYDSPLFFLLDRRYHYPPDRVSVELVQTMFMLQAPDIDYNPLAQDPDYLVVKQPFMMWWTLYEAAIRDGEFRLIQTYGRYKIYERVRTGQIDRNPVEQEPVLRPAVHQTPASPAA